MKRKNVSLFVGVLIALIGTVFSMAGCKQPESDPVYTRTDMSFEIENKSGVACSVVVDIDASNTISSSSKLVNNDIATSGTVSFTANEKKTVTVKGVLLSGKTNQSSRDYDHYIIIKASNGGSPQSGEYRSSFLRTGLLKSWDNAHFDITKNTIKFIVTKQ